MRMIHYAEHMHDMDIYIYIVIYLNDLMLDNYLEQNLASHNTIRNGVSNM